MEVSNETLRVPHVWNKVEELPFWIICRVGNSLYNFPRSRGFFHLNNLDFLWKLQIRLQTEAIMVDCRAGR